MYWSTTWEIWLCWSWQIDQGRAFTREGSWGCHSCGGGRRRNVAKVLSSRTPFACYPDQIPGLLGWEIVDHQHVSSIENWKLGFFCTPAKEAARKMIRSPIGFLSDSFLVLWCQAFIPFLFFDIKLLFRIYSVVVREVRPWILRHRGDESGTPGKELHRVLMGNYFPFAFLLAVLSAGDVRSGQQANGGRRRPKRLGVAWKNRWEWSIVDKAYAKKKNKKEDKF